MALNNLGLGFHVSAKDDASGALQNVSDKLTKTKQAADKAKVSFEDIGGEAGNVGQKLAIAGAAGVAGLGLAAKAASDFETAVAKVATIAPSAEFPMEKIRDIGFSMAQTYGGDLETQLAALYSAIGSGAESAADATKLLASANQLAIGGLTTVDAAMNGLMGTLNSYGMAYSRATEVTDSFFQAVMLGGSDMSIDTLAAGLGNIAPLASAFGVSLDELTGSIARLTAVGQKTDVAITNLKSAMEVMLKPSADAVKEAKRLGIQFDQAALKSKGFLGMVKEITSANGYNEESMKKLFGQSVLALNAMLALGANGGAEYQKFMDSMAEKTGKTEFAFKKLADTAAFASSVLKANFQTALVKVGDIIAPILGSFLVVINALIVRFNNLPKGVQKLIVGLFALTSVAFVVIGAILGVVSAVAAAAAAGEALLIAVAAAAGLFAQFIIVAGAAAAVFYLFKRAYEENLGGFGDFVDKVYSKVKLAFDALTQLFSDGAFSGSVLAELKKTENAGIKDFAIQAFLWFNRLKNFFSGVADGFATAMKDLAPAFTRLVAVLKDIGKVLGFVKDGPEEAAEKFNAFGATGERVGKVIGDVAGFMLDIFTGVAQAVRYAVEAFVFMRKLGAPLSSAFGSVFDSFVRLGEALGLVSKTGTSQGDMWKTLGAVIGFVVGGIVNSIATFVNYFATVVAVVASLVGGIIQMFQGLWNFFAGFFEVFNALFTGNWGAALDGAKRMVFGFVQFVAGIFNALAGAVFGIVDKIAQAFGKTSNLAGDLKKETSSILNSVQQGLNLQTATGGQDRRALPVVGAANPAVGQTGAQAAANAANAAQPAQLNANITVPVVLDGDKVGEANAKYQAGQAARSGAPNPAPT